MATSQVHASSPTTPAAANIESPLLRLPLELRQIIYSIIFGPRRVVDITHVRLELDKWTRSQIYCPESQKQYGDDRLGDFAVARFRSDSISSDSDIEPIAHHPDPTSMYEWMTGILGVSKAISDEALDILYGQNVFVADIHSQGHLQLAKLSVANLQRIRYLRIVAKSMDLSYRGPLVLDDQLWVPLLGGLSQFCLVAQQPLEAGPYFDALTFEEDMHKWNTWLEPILQYFSLHISKSTVISLDADEKVEIKALMDKHFSARYEEVRTLTGDLCFERGQFSHETDYFDSDDGGFRDDSSD